jgi:hypothetical protein
MSAKTSSEDSEGSESERIKRYKMYEKRKQDRIAKSFHRSEYYYNYKERKKLQELEEQKALALQEEANKKLLEHKRKEKNRKQREKRVREAFQQQLKKIKTKGMKPCYVVVVRAEVDPNVGTMHLQKVQAFLEHSVQSHNKDTNNLSAISSKVRFKS